MRRMRNNVPSPTDYPHWKGTMAGWRHGKEFLANHLYVDGHVSVVKPRVPTTPREIKNTVDTVRTFTWLPGERPDRMDGHSYSGEVEYYRGPPPWVPKFITEGGYNQPAAYPEELHPAWRTNNRAWSKLPADPRDRN